MKFVAFVLLVASLVLGSLYASQRRTAIQSKANTADREAAADAGSHGCRLSSFASTTDLADLLPCYMEFGGEVVLVEELLLGKHAQGRLGFAYLVATRADGRPFIIDDVESYDVVSSRTEDLASAYVPSTVVGESRSIAELRFAIDDEERLFVSYWRGAYRISGSEFTIDYELGMMTDPVCCKLQLGIPDCVDHGCDGAGGVCGTPPYTCACVGGNGVCLSGAGIQMCYGNCGVTGCNAGQCAHWIDPLGVERCGCRSS